MTTAPAARRPRKPLGAALEGLRWTWLLLAFLIAWEVVFRLRPSLFVPPMSRILGHMAARWFSADPAQWFTTPFFHENALASLERLAWGWGVAVLIGVAGGLLLGVSRPLEAFFRPIVRFGMATPATILLPVAVVVFGITDRMNIFLIVAGAVWPVLLNTMDGVRGIDSAVLDSARSLRLPRWRVVPQVLLPAASPQIFAGLRVSLGIALILMVVSEMFVATRGIGFQIVFSQRTFAFLDMWASVALVGLLGIVLNGLFFVLERRVLAWHRERRAGQR